jgi:hypothetical protein
MGSVTVREDTWRNTDAWFVRGEELEVVVMQVGGHLAALRSIDDELNPLWQPPWPAVPPEEASNHPDIYGDGAEASLLAALVGHNLCLDRFGPPWPGEDKPVHGEAGVVRWTLDEGGPERAMLSAELPQAGLHVSRELRIGGDSLRLTTTVRHDGDQPRDVEWAEHVTLGDPFLDGAEFSADADGAWVWGGEPRAHWRFPEAVPEGEVNFDAALEMPPASEARTFGDIVASRLVRGWFRAARPDLGRYLEYEWDADEFPWLCLWTQHRSRTAPPWNGEVRARGMEFSTKPFPEGRPPEERARRFEGTPTTCSVPPGDGLRRSITVRWGRL